MVRKKGFEPSLPCGHKLLRLARLPVPPLPHEGGTTTVWNTQVYQPGRATSRISSIARGGAGPGGPPAERQRGERHGRTDRDRGRPVDDLHAVLSGWHHDAAKQVVGP